MAEQEKAGPAEADAETATESASDSAHTGGASSVTTEDTEATEASSRDTQNGQDDEIAVLRHTIEELKTENTELRNQHLRKQADMENYRKRMVRDKENAVQFSNQQLLLDMTSIIDDFERAIRSAEESRDYDSFHDGIVLIENQLTNMLDREWGLKRFDSEGEVFDPQKHEAVATEPRQEHDESIVIEDYQRGYLLHERVLRSAKVKVSVPTTDGEETDKE